MPAILSRTVRALKRSLAVLVGAAVLLLVAPAHAQFGGMGAMQGQETITKRGVEAYVKILGLDKDQREVAMTLFEGYSSEHQAAQKKMEDGMKTIQEKVADTQDFSLYQTEMPKLAKEFAEKSKTLEKNFFDDLKTASNESQMANWPKLERYHRRESGMRFGFLSGAAIDLILVVDRVKAAPADKLAPVLDQYELDIDKDLVTFKKMEEEAQNDMFKGDGAMFDMTRIENMMKKFYDVSKEMRDTNREYARKLSQLMDDASKAKFDAEFKRRSFPRIYKPAHVIKMMDVALTLPDLDASQKETITGLKTSYEHDAAAANEKWAKAVEEREEKAGGNVMAMMKSMQAMQGGGGSDLNKDVNAARAVRKELDEKTKDRLTGVLKDDQKAKLPEAPREDNNPWADFMPNADDEGQ